MSKPKINLWRLIPAGLDGVRAGIEGIEAATQAESDGGHEVTPEEARDIAEAIGRAVAARVLRDLLGAG